MADIAMEIKGKAVGGGEAAAHLVLCVVLCVVCVCDVFYLSIFGGKSRRIFCYVGR